MTRHAVDARQALARLKEGNERFVKNVRSIESLATSAARAQLVEGQQPFAIVLSCSDSRAPSELLFDAGLGELFVVRVAGNIVAPSLVGSVEFAAATFGTELVVVMGHTRCGAVKATIDAVTRGAQAPSDNVGDIVRRIEPSVRELAGIRDGDALMKAATRANVRASVNHLRSGSRILEERIAAGRLLVVGAEYALETGQVDFFDVP
ncbi:MAG: carbonic anhydrase [Archangium sp.]|nr:carbonic anhydrase [Archangium sp.]